MTEPAAILLAAGEGRRMGGPKALLVVNGAPLVCSHVERLQDAGCQPIVVVVRTTIIGEVRAAIGERAHVEIVAADTSSMAASLSFGLKRVPPTPGRAIVISTVDSLPARLTTLRQLSAAVAETGVEVATPTYRGRSGHPIVARETLVRAFREGYSGTLRDLIRGVGSARRRIEVDDPAVGHDLDTPADLASIVAVASE